MNGKQNFTLEVKLRQSNREKIDDSDTVNDTAISQAWEPQFRISSGSCGPKSHFAKLTETR